MCMTARVRGYSRRVRGEEREYYQNRNTDLSAQIPLEKRYYTSKIYLEVILIVGLGSCMKDAGLIGGRNG